MDLLNNDFLGRGITYLELLKGVATYGIVD